MGWLFSNAGSRCEKFTKFLLKPSGNRAILESNLSSGAKTRIMKARALLFGITLTCSIFAQNNIPIQWGNVEKFRGTTSKIVNVNGQSFTVVVNRASVFEVLLPNRRKLILRDVASLNTAAEKKIQLKGDNKNLSAAAVEGLNNQLVTLSYRSTDMSTRNSVFAHVFNPNSVEKSVQGEQVISYFNINVPSSSKRIGMINSEDNSKVAAFFTIPVRPNEFPGFGYLIYDETLGKIAQHTTQLPYQQFQLEFSEAFLSNNGDFYILAEEYYPLNAAVPINPNNRAFARMRAFKALDGKFEEFDINRDGIIIMNMRMSTNNDQNFVASGFYADDLFSGVRGVFFMTLDRKTNAVLQIKKQPFTAQFLSSGQAAWEQSWRDRNRQNSTKPQALSDFRVLDFRPTQDGGFVVITENQSVMLVAKQTGTPQNPRITYTENFFFDDLIIYKLNESGDLSWVKRLPKNQRSINDKGQFLSVAHGVTANHVYLIFNDIKRNYDNNNNFIEGQFPFPMQYVAGNNVIAYVEMNLSDGTFTRQARPGLSQNQVVLIPGLCEFNYNTNEMIVYGKRNRKHRFGHMKMR